MEIIAQNRLGARQIIRPFRGVESFVKNAGVARKRIGNLLYVFNKIKALLLGNGEQSK